MLTKEEADYLRIILGALYGDKEVSCWNMNEKVLEVLNIVLDKNRVCSQAMDYVPRPTLGKPGLEYIRSQLKGIAERVLKRTHSFVDTYWICGEFTKWSYKSIFADAASGVAEP